MTTTASMCRACSRYRDAATCDAFPSGIPIAIFSGERSHVAHVDGDRGLQFELDPQSRPIAEVLVRLGRLPREALR